MAARHRQRGEPRYGLAVFASKSGIGLSAYVASEAGELKLISEEELREKAPDWHAVLLLCRAERKVQVAVGNLPPQIQREAGLMVQVTSLFGQFGEIPLLADPARSENSASAEDS